MGKNRAKSVKSILLRSQILTGLAVMSIVTTILTVLLLSLANYFDKTRIVELAHSIESQALITRSSRHLQYAVTNLVENKHVGGIAIFNRSDRKVLAANDWPSKQQTTQWILTDKKIRNLVDEAFNEGLFGVNLFTDSHRQISIMPLGLPIHDIVKNDVIIGAKWSVPKWHEKIELKPLSAQAVWSNISTILHPRATHEFELNSADFSGVIVIETNRDWITGLVWRGIFIFTSLMAFSIAAVLLSLFFVLRKNILRPINRYIEVISARRAGDNKVRVPVSNVVEFDELANQWNSLLDFREVAQGQNMVLSTLLEHVPVGIDVTDAESKIEYANPSFLEMTGFSLAEVIGKTPESLIASNKMDYSVLGDSLVSIANGTPWSGEVTYKRKDQTDLICNTTFVPIHGESGKLERLISVRLDITKLKTDEKSLIAAKYNAETADQAKSKFLANMSHELRTPLNAIIGFSEMMAGQKLGPLGTEEYVEFSKLIETSSRTLLSSINLILDLSRFDAQQMQLDASDFDVSEVLHNIVEAKTEQAHAVGIEIKRDFQSDIIIQTDQRMMRQTIGYLISNAIQYNHEGGTIWISTVRQDDKVIVSIKDSGIGISPDNLKKVTEPFYRVDAGLTQLNDGAGLGLALVKKFADEQKIGFKMESELEKGTTVSLIFSISGKTKNKTASNSEKKFA